MTFTSNKHTSIKSISVAGTVLDAESLGGNLFPWDAPLKESPDVCGADLIILSKTALPGDDTGSDSSSDTDSEKVAFIHRFQIKLGVSKLGKGDATEIVEKLGGAVVFDGLTELTTTTTTTTNDTKMTWKEYCYLITSRPLTHEADTFFTDSDYVNVICARDVLPAIVKQWAKDNTLGGSYYEND